MKELIVSCNLKKFDLISYVQDHESVFWKQTKTVRRGDRVYIYVGAPHSRLYYRCDVLDCDLKYSSILMPYYPYYSDQKPTKYMKLGKIKELPLNGLALSNLLANGVKTVQCSTEVSSVFHDYLSSIIN